MKRLAVACLAVMAVLFAPVAAAAGTIVQYTGQGFEDDGALKSERCGALEGANDGSTGQFANWNGPGMPYQTGQGYLLWILTANGASSATLALPDGTVAMIKVGGTFKYASRYYNVDELTGVFADYAGRAKWSVQLVVSHGCAPFNGGEGAWCSPGYWKNASDASWALTGREKTDLFNGTVVPLFYATASAADPSLFTVLTTPGANTFGAADAPHGLNAFNATAAYLTEQLDGFHFDASLMGTPEACPIDHHGVLK